MRPSAAGQHKAFIATQFVLRWSEDKVQKLPDKFGVSEESNKLTFFLKQLTFHINRAIFISVNLYFAALYQQ